MRPSRPIRTRALVPCLLLLAACAGRAERDPALVPAGSSVGVYRVRIHQQDDRSRRFKLLLFAALPDRLHGEVVSPVGTTELIVDAGADRIAVTPVDERTSYVGRSRPAVLEGLLGIRVSLTGLVRGLLLGERPSGIDGFAREGADGPALPERLEIVAGSVRVELELRRLRPLPTGDRPPGTGEPPAGFDVLPLRDLDLVTLPAGEPPAEGGR